MAAAKQNITLAINKSILKRARALAAGQGLSVSSLLAQHLKEMVEKESDYQRAKLRAFERLDHPFDLGGARITDRESLHDRQSLR